MSSTFGNLFRLTTWGESHGPATGCVIDGCPSNMPLSADDIQKELDRRSPGKSPVVTARREADKVEILSGVFEGRTIGTPISLTIKNTDADPSKYAQMKDLLRPGQAEYTWREKYGIIDFRGGGRASARETAARVAGGAVAKKALAKRGIEIIAYSREIAGVVADTSDMDYSKSALLFKRIESSSVRSPDSDSAAEMEHAILAAKERKDSVGGVVEAVALNVPVGLGEPVFDKLSADLAKAVFSIPGVKGFEIGGGFELARMTGSQANDPFVIGKGRITTSTNNAGGIIGGLSSGMPIVIRAAFKPTASIGIKQKTVDYTKKKAAEIEVLGRHDPCIVPRAVPVVEAMMALVLADHAMRSGILPGRFD